MKLGKALIPCGISSAFFGLVFGSVFGFEEALNPLYKLLFNLDEKPIDVLAPNTTIMILCAALGIGVALVMVAMLINIYSCIKRKRLGAALFGANGVCGLVFYASLVIGTGTCPLHCGISHVEIKKDEAGKSADPLRDFLRFLRIGIRLCFRI